MIQMGWTGWGRVSQGPSTQATHLTVSSLQGRRELSGCLAHSRCQDTGWVAATSAMFSLPFILPTRSPRFEYWFSLPSEGFPS